MSRRVMAERFANGESAIALAEEYGVNRSTVYRARDKYATQVKQAKPVIKPFGEFGVSGLTRFGGQVMEDYLRPWETLDRMVPLVKEMLDHPVIGAIIFAIEMTIRRADWSVTPFAEDQTIDNEAADFVRQCKDDMSHTMDMHVEQVLSMLGYGFSTFEVVYKRRLGTGKDPESQYDDGLIGWRKFAFRSQDTLTPGDEWIFDDHGGIQGMNQTNPDNNNVLAIPIKKMLLYRTTTAKNNPQGKSAIRPSYIPWYYAKNLAEIEGIAAERLGTGVPVIYLGEDVTKGDDSNQWDYAKKAVRDLRVDEQMGLAFPYPKQIQSGDKAGRGILFEFVSPPSQGGIDFEAAIQRYNQMISQTLLAQFVFLGLAERGTQSLAVRATDFFAQAIEGWLEGIADVLNRYAIPPLMKLNAAKFAGITGYPKFETGPISQVDVQRLFEAVDKATTHGFLKARPGDEQLVRTLLEFPEMSDEDMEKEREHFEEDEELERERKKNPPIPPVNPFQQGDQQSRSNDLKNRSDEDSQ